MIDGKPYAIPSYPLEECLIITPGINKYKEGYSVPFDIHRTRANSEIDSAQRYIIIGYGFGDDYFRNAFNSTVKCRKTRANFNMFFVGDSKDTGQKM